jgi:hypothetical protein
MPPHNPVNKDREFEMDILVVEKKVLERVPDGHVRIRFEWRGGTHSWFIEGVSEPETYLLDPKHNWNVYDNNLPKSQGDAILALLDWVKVLTQHA